MKKCDILNVNWCKISSTGCISVKWKTLTQISEFPPLFSRRTVTVGHFDLAGKAQKDNQNLHLIHRQLLLCSLLNGIFLPRCHFWVRQQKEQPKDLERYQSSASIIEFLCVTKKHLKKHTWAPKLFQLLFCQFPSP